MSHDNNGVLAALAQVGITISPSSRPAGGWGWAISNQKLSQPWVGPYPTEADAIGAVLGWLMTRAWKGTLCIHTHSADPDLAWRPEPADDDARPLDAALLAPWLKAFAE